MCLLLSSGICRVCCCCWWENYTRILFIWLGKHEWYLAGLTLCIILRESVPYISGTFTRSINCLLSILDTKNDLQVILSCWLLWCIISWPLRCVMLHSNVSALLLQVFLMTTTSTAVVFTTYNSGRRESYIKYINIDKLYHHTYNIWFYLEGEDLVIQ